MAQAYRGDTFQAMAVQRILTLAGLCAAQIAQASPRSDPTAGRAVFTGATEPHATSIALAPAALGLGSFDEVYLALAGTIDQRQIALDGIALDGSRTPAPKVSSVELGPAAMLAFIYHLAGETVTIGFEARTIAPETFPSQHDPLRYHTLGGGERDWLASAAASFRVTNGLFFGASFTHQNTYLRLRYARDTALGDGRGERGVASPCGDATCGLDNPLATEIYDVDVRSPLLSTSNLRVTIGGVYQLARDVWLGVSYHTPPGFSVQTELVGQVEIEPAPRDRDAGRQPLRGDSVVVIQLPASVDAELRARLPLSLDLHLGGRWEDLSRLQSYDVRTYGRVLPANGIPEWTQRPRGMHDSFAGWGGVEQVDTGQALLFGARVGFETSALPSRRTSPVTIAPTSVTADLGAQWRTPYRLILQLSYGLSYFPTVNTRDDGAFDPNDRLACIDNNFDYTTSECMAVREGYAISSAAGDYTRLEHALRIGLRYEFP
jgi:hypothetical protein